MHQIVLYRRHFVMERMSKATSWNIWVQRSVIPSRCWLYNIVPYLDQSLILNWRHTMRRFIPMLPQLQKTSVSNSLFYSYCGNRFCTLYIQSPIKQLQSNQLICQQQLHFWRKLLISFVSWGTNSTTFVKQLRVQLQNGTRQKPHSRTCASELRNGFWKNSQATVDGKLLAIDS